MSNVLRAKYKNAENGNAKTEPKDKEEPGRILIHYIEFEHSPVSPET